MGLHNYYHSGGAPTQDVIDKSIEYGRYRDVKKMKIKVNEHIFPACWDLSLNKGALEFKTLCYVTNFSPEFKVTSVDLMPAAYAHYSLITFPSFKECNIL